MTTDHGGGPDDEVVLSDFDYRLPPDRIAQEPVRPRDASRLLVLDRAGGGIAHRRFRDLPDVLEPADLLVLNDTRVIPAAFTARRASGGRIEGCFLRRLDDGLWEVLLAGRGRIREGETLEVIGADGRPAAGMTLHARGEAGLWRVRPPEAADPVALLAAVGRPPPVTRGRPLTSAITRPSMPGATAPWRRRRRVCTSPGASSTGSTPAASSG